MKLGRTDDGDSYAELSARCFPARTELRETRSPPPRHAVPGSMHARIAGVVTGMSGAMILVAGITRLGFIDSVLSRPFLRGFISAIGVVILADQLIPEMGLAELAKELEVDHGSSVQKVVFLVEHVGKAHWPTTLVAFISFFIAMVCRCVNLPRPHLSCPD